MSVEKNMYNLYPELDTLKQFSLKVDDTHEIYYEMCGNPQGYPVVFLHGGPGSGCNPTQRRFFDPTHYCIILIDQRGCGRSKPQGETSKNTTADLVSDIDAIRTALGFEKWLVFGGSWGSTLALSYALAHTEHVTGLILRGIFLSRANELNWFLGDVAHFYPEVWSNLVNYLPKNEQHDVLAAYSKRIFNNDINIGTAAALQWNAFENAIMRLVPSEPKATEAEKPTVEQSLIEVARARVQIHYIAHECFVDGESILKECVKLAHIPTIIVQGRYDMVCPPKSAWELSRAMPHAEFNIVQDAGHSALETGTTSALVAATEQFKSLANNK